MDKPKRKRKPRKRDPANKKISCPDCNRKFYFQCQLTFHQLVHTGEKPYTCDVCDKAFNTPYSLKNHKYIHTDEKPFKCSFCKYACRDSSTLRKHQQKHMGIETAYQCKMCEKRYTDKWRLKNHVSETHFNVDLRTIPCEKCGKLYKTKTQLNTHIKLVHKRAKAGSCPVCNVYIPNMNNLDTHLTTHIDARPYVCNMAGCKRAYKDKSSLNKHMVVHSPDEHYPCDFCGRLFARESRLQRHIITVHGKTKRVECDYCGVKFFSKAYLINHIAKKHAKKRKKYICDMCGLVTYNKPSIVMHIKRGHGSENDRECKICHTIYKKHIYLKAHYKNTHKIAYKTKTRLPLIIKEEPPDDAASIPEEDTPIEPIDLFEIEKTEPDLNLDTSQLDTTEPEYPEQPELQTVIQCERVDELPNTVFDQLYVETIRKLGWEERGLEKSKDPPKPTSKYQGNIDKKALEYFKKCKTNILAEAKKKEALKALERARQIYNERMKSFVKKVAAGEEKKKPIKIKLFKKKQEKCSKVEQNDDFDDQTQNDDNNSSSTDKNDEMELKIPVDNEIKVNELTNSDDNQKTSNANKNNLADEIMSNNNESKISDENYKINDEITNEKTEVNDKESSTDGGISENDKTDDDDEWNDKKNKKIQKNRKINFNSHQCYICFKLYETKEKLLDHCKDHFDVCNENCLKKCPLCPYVTKRTIKRHLRFVHGVNVKIPYGKLQDKKDNVNGCRYYFEIDDPLVHKMEIIPSVKNLNKLASMKIDRRERENKYKTIAKTKLVRKGKEWVVETEKIKIDKDVILTKFDDEDLKKINMKIGDTDGYLDGLKKMYQLAKKTGKTMLFPCESCDKVCRNLAALKLHNRKHEANPKPFRKKVWKHKLKDQVTKENTNNKTAKKVKPLGNRSAKPRPIKNKHKCDPELKDFYKNNIRGGDIEFWQFLKIFNKMSRENINDFKDVEGKQEYQAIEGESEFEEEEEKTEKIVTNSEPNSEIDKTSNRSKDNRIKPKNKTKVNKEQTQKKVYKRVIRISKKEFERRNLAKQQLREKFQKSQEEAILNIGKNTNENTNN